ncbi:MAG: hypothetical protein WCK96_01245 [Methylococcales bacterium]
MRPVERGFVPLDSNGNGVKFKTYGDARDYLIGRLGDYCSYCESPLLAPAVEHVQPQSTVPELRNHWYNFLLACVFCNSVKKDTPININSVHNYFWASQQNTFRAFRYEKDRAPQIAMCLKPAHRQIAQNTLELTGLDREPSHPKLTVKDRRWIKRNEAWAKAEQAKQRLNQQPIDLMREQIIDTATSTGFWSVWMTVFQDNIDMRQRLINAFTGTSRACFDANTQPIQRAGGQL